MEARGVVKWRRSLGKHVTLANFRAHSLHDKAVRKARAHLPNVGSHLCGAVLACRLVIYDTLVIQGRNTVPATTPGLTPELESIPSIGAAGSSSGRSSPSVLQGQSLSIHQTPSGQPISQHVP